MKSLKSLDLSNLYTPFLEYMEYAFQYCSSLKTIELPNFNNSQIKGNHPLEGKFNKLLN